MGLSGCAASLKSDLGKIPTYKSSNIQIVDNRLAQDKIYRRNSVLSPVAKLGDNNFKPSIIEHLKLAIHQKVKSVGSHSIRVQKLNIYDVFADRMSVSTSGALAGMGVYGSPTAPTNTDYVLIEFKGTYNNKPVALKVTEPYRASPWSTNIYNDKSFKKAINVALGKIVNQLVK